MPRTSRGIPDRWMQYSEPMGKRMEGTRFLCFKTPLKPQLLNNQVPHDLRFTTSSVMSTVGMMGHQLGLVIDLTNTSRYYDADDFLRMNIYYHKLNCPGHEINTQPDLVAKFHRIVQQFEADNADNDLLIGVHCTHGVNRTGYLVCHYLIQHKGWSPERAIQAFSTARGYGIEREAYLNSLKYVALNSHEARASSSSRGSPADRKQRSSQQSPREQIQAQEQPIASTSDGAPAQSPVEPTDPTIGEDKDTADVPETALADVSMASAASPVAPEPEPVIIISAAPQMYNRKEPDQPKPEEPVKQDDGSPATAAAEPQPATSAESSMPVDVSQSLAAFTTTYVDQSNEYMTRAIEHRHGASNVKRLSKKLRRQLKRAKLDEAVFERIPKETRQAAVVNMMNILKQQMPAVFDALHEQKVKQEREERELEEQADEIEDRQLESDEDVKETSDAKDKDKHHFDSDRDEAMSSDQDDDDQGPSCLRRGKVVYAEMGQIGKLDKGTKSQRRRARRQILEHRHRIMKRGKFWQIREMQKADGKV